MIEMLKDLINDLKVELSFKEVGKFFLFGLLITAFIFFVPMGKEFNSETLITIFGFALVFVFLYICTKSYGHFVDGFYQGHIDRLNRKNGVKQTSSKKKNKK